MASSQLVLVVVRLRPTGCDEATFVAGVRETVAALRSRPGHRDSRLARALDDPALWVLVSEWDDVGSYRRAVSSYDVRMASADIMNHVINEPSAFQEVGL